MADPADVTILAAPAILYILGFASGYIVSTWVGGLTKADMQERIALLITLIWVLSVTADMVVPDYDTAVWIHAIMGGVAGYLFSGEAGLSIFPGRDSTPSPPDSHAPRHRAYRHSPGGDPSAGTDDPRETTDGEEADETPSRQTTTDDSNSHP